MVGADDRTGAFEVAALFAQVVGPVTVTVGTAPSGAGVVDLGTRAMTAADAARAAVVLEASPSAWVAHKIDSTLRGNWVAELSARQRASGRRVVVLPGWPELGRTCVGGVVYADGVPIGALRDYLDNAVLLSDADALLSWLETEAPIAVYDVPNSHAMHTAANALVGHDVLLAGPAGPLGAAFAASHVRVATSSAAEIEPPVLVVCGSANPVAREQVRRLRGVELVATEASDGELRQEAVLVLAEQVRLRIDQLQPRTIVIIGGETVAAVLGDAPQVITGFAARGMPCGRDDHGRLLISKAGGFGGPDALVDLLRGEND